MKVHRYKNSIWKFRYSEKATKFEKISQYIWHYTLNWEIFFQNFVDFSEYLNFRNNFTPLWIAACWNIVMHIWNLTMCFSHEALQQCWPTMHSRTYMLFKEVLELFQFATSFSLNLKLFWGLWRGTESNNS